MIDNKWAVLYLDEYGDGNAQFFERVWGLKTKHYHAARKAVEQQDYKLTEFDIAIIDAQDDKPVNVRKETLSEILKRVKPDIFIIGTSIMGQFFQNDPVAKQMYDERISWRFPEEYLDRVKEALRSRGYLK